MTDRRNIHVLPHPLGWALQREGGARAYRVYATKADAQEQGRRLARKHKVEVIVHGNDDLMHGSRPEASRHEKRSS